MKRCSACNRTYTDPGLSFCIDDGTPLSVVPDEETTVVSQQDPPSAPAYQPPAAYVPEKRRRKVWPWVVGIIGAFIFGIIAISIVAAIMIPRMMRSAPDQQPRVVIDTPSENSTAESTNSNSDTDGDVDTAPPTDHDQVLAQLNDLEHEWTVANLNADKKKLDRILADDYVGPSDDGTGLQGKAEYIRTIERNTSVDRWEFSDLKLVLAGDRATLSGTIKFVIRGKDVIIDFTDKFVWRDGRWQATGSKIKRRE
jgi:hypothetical protein